MSIPGFRSLLTMLGAGFEPAGIVMGAGTFQIIRPASCRGVGMMARAGAFVYPVYEQALRDAWQDVIMRLEAEAANVGAHGVVGVSMAQEFIAESQVSTGQTVEAMQLRLVGTAVEVPGVAPLQRPFVSMLSMDEVLKLMLRGWMPSGIAVGISAVHVHSWSASPLSQGIVFANAEMAAPTSGMALARGRAEAEVRKALVDRGGGGTVAADVQLNYSQQRCSGSGGGLLIEGLIIGTSVVRYREPVVAMSGVRNLSSARSS